MNRRERLKQARALRAELIADRDFMNELRRELPALVRMGKLTKRQARIIKQD
jgi:hypothetical protein